MIPLLLLGMATVGQAKGQAKPTPPPVSTPGPKVPTNLPPKYVAPTPDGVVARVDGQDIPAKDISGMLWEVRGAELEADFVRLVLVRQAAAKQNITVQQIEVDRRLQENIKAYDASSKQAQDRPPGETVQDYLLKKGYPLSRLYLGAELELTLDKLAEKTFHPESYIKVSVMIFTSTDATPANLAIAKKNAQAALAKLKKGDKWDEVLKTSQEPQQLIPTNGQIGWVESATIPPDIQAQLKPLKPGLYTDPLLMRNSYQIYRLDLRGADATGADLDGLKADYLRSERPKLLNSLQTAAKIEYFPTKEAGS